MAEKTGEKEQEHLTTTRLGAFIQTYSSFLSSFVIGVAGLIATSIWQFKQSEIARRQADSQQKLAEIKAENDWRIERAEILSKNLQVLSAHGQDSVDQRYGVLLSLTRGSILDPELAVSYALELGKDNPNYMHSVLASTEHKNYLQLLQAFVLTCDQRFGVSKDVAICKNDQFSDRSDEIAQLIADEMTAARQRNQEGPIILLKEERLVHDAPGRLSWLFDPYLTDLYERRQWNEIEAFEKYSTGSRLVAALVLATVRTGELVTTTEQAQLEKFHDDRRKWLVTYLSGRNCDGECKGKLVDSMLSVYGYAEGDYDDALRRLLMAGRAESGPAIARLHTRILWCQIDDNDLVALRDHVLVSSLDAVLKQPKNDPQIINDLADLIAMVPEPKGELATELANFRQVVAKLKQQQPEQYKKAFLTRRNVAIRERQSPPPAMRGLTFCNAQDPNVTALAMPEE